jgi:tRNA/rRNA methyltransferase
MGIASKRSAPVIILVHPQLGENIGAVARAMSNFGFSELRLVAPRDGWPNEKALHMASGAEIIIEKAKLFPDFRAAMADIQFAYATTARPRDMEKRTVTPDAAMKEMNGGEKTALVFGPERTGLENDDIVLCDALITIPTAPEKTSLNLAQSMVIVGYEWFKQCSVVRVQSSESTPTELRTPNSDHSAPKAQWQGLFNQLDAYLEDADYYRTPDKKPLMWQNMQNMFLRGQWSEQEIRTFRGMLRVLWEGRKPRKK